MQYGSGKKIPVVKQRDVSKLTIITDVDINLKWKNEPKTGTFKKDRRLDNSSSLSSEDISDHSSVESVTNNEESPVPEIKIQNAPNSRYSKSSNK